MKRYLLPLFAIVILAACGSSKTYLERNDADRALQDAVKKLAKDKNNEEALSALPILYNNIKLEHLAKIKSYNKIKDISRFDLLIKEYQALQNAYNAILNNSAAFKIVNPQYFGTELLETNEAAAEATYSVAESYLAKQNKDDAKRAYMLFQRTDKYVPGFKDSKTKMQEAYESAIVNIVINRVEDNSYFFNSGWGNTGYNYSNQYFQESLVRELQKNNSYNRYAARFYTDWDARRDNVEPDWVVDLRLRDINIPYPITSNYQRQVSANVQDGRDTSGKLIYRTVYATLNLTRQSLDATAAMEMNIRDIRSNRSISYRSFSKNYRWQQESGSYTGDRRALSNSDWAIINNNNYNSPRKEDVLEDLYRKIYPQVKNEITNQVDW
ncbi:MAG: hypothetical protein ACKVOM_02485 [Ferruginibacter sp.]